MSTQEVDDVNLATLSFTAIICENVFSRDCFARCLRFADSECIVSCFSSVNAWVGADEPLSGSVVLICAMGARATELAVRRDLVAIREACTDAKTIIVSNVERADQIVEALESGAKGYIPMSLPLDVAIEAIHLVRAGGTFVPAGALLASRNADQGTSANLGGPDFGLFTERQIEVIKAIRLGKPNKIIAHELNMGECTVKVHIRNIMRRLNARNRTEVAYLTNGLFTRGYDEDRDMPEISSNNIYA